MTRDLSGYSREGKIRSSGVRNVFTPNTPINNAEFLAGRTDEMTRLLAQFDTPGLHSLLYGERGVGKSSLANVYGYLVNYTYQKKLGDFQYGRVSCNSRTTFEDILKESLKKLNVDATVQQIDSKEGVGVGMKAKATLANFLGVEGDINAKKEVTTIRNGPSKYIDPSFAAKILKNHPGLLIIDEADRMINQFDKKLLAELIKQLSDSGSMFKILIVGVAETGGELIENHESISRCLGEIKLGRMTDKELELIIKKGGEKLHLSFDKQLIDKIVELSKGYPHFTHLLALKCAEDAVAEVRNHIGIRELPAAIKRTITEYEGAFKRSYDSAIISPNTDMYRIILVAAANLNKSEFSADEWRKEISKIIGKDIPQQSLSNYYKKLVHDDNSTIIRRIKKGVYRFNDPRMSSYIKIVNESKEY